MSAMFVVGNIYQVTRVFRNIYNIKDLSNPLRDLYFVIFVSNSRKNHVGDMIY